ncbi:L-seryl-tRNA(Sec) selenium transferase [Proteiniclasticum sp. QWL-01]|uniref:L-seryl-tRNA(Sec) selenium transferase n=1 Tax=Proteiniclasticum sp. QWL-01 TaxID=3036945 RepID=UPI00241104CC|nr:L-seryl-tRNA(Sec) selenium transferase [Proteiniclasticum sp. QWL-01]WFF73134.1 L-seryl-tRNA(Sec) selenium transferase [Proteiniclasticum sp. QWL-01]
MAKVNIMRLLPSVDELFKHEKLAALNESIPAVRIKNSVRDALTALREEYLARKDDPDFIPYDEDEIVEKVLSRILAEHETSLKKVINGTGIVIHTNLGRSLLPEVVRDALLDAAFSYNNLEYDLKSGQRGSRYTHLESTIKELTGAEDVLVVNNNAAAVMLALNTMVQGREAIISRGELVEIGGSFRVPEVLKMSGGFLREVGTTNKTHLYDYEEAICEETGILLKVHTSNYHIIGFTETVDGRDLAELGRKHDIPVVEDLGSGLFVDLSKYGLEYEPTVRDTLAKGVDVVTFSGDKLLGGPQAGIIVGRKKYIQAMKKNQLTRALRVDKMTISALEATLRLYLDEDRAMAAIPTMRMLTLTLEELAHRAEVLYRNLLRKVKTCHLDVVDCQSQVGGGSLPQERLPSRAVTIVPMNMSLNDFERRMRLGKYHVIGKIHKERYELDVRTFLEGDMEKIVDAVKLALKDNGRASAE